MASQVDPIEDMSYIAVSRGVKYGASIRERKTFDASYREPEDLHLIYIRMDGPELVVRHMRKLGGVNQGNVAATEDDLIRQAKAGNGHYAQDFARLEFQAGTYLTMVVDIPGWDFYYPYPSSPEPVPNELHDPLVFIEKKRPSENSASKNFAFYNAQRVETLGCKGFRCINFFTEEGGAPIMRYVDYKFEIYLVIPFAASFSAMSEADFAALPAGAAQRHITIIIDPDGQNQGP